MIAPPYFLKNKEWYYHDGEVCKLWLTTKGVKNKKAAKSYRDFRTKITMDGIWYEDGLIGLTDEERKRYDAKMKPVMDAYFARFGVSLPFFYELQIPDGICTVEKKCAYIFKQIRENKPFEEDDVFWGRCWKEYKIKQGVATDQEVNIEGAK